MHVSVERNKSDLITRDTGKSKGDKVKGKVKGNAKRFPIVPPHWIVLPFGLDTTSKVFKSIVSSLKSTSII